MARGCCEEYSEGQKTYKLINISTGQHITTITIVKYPKFLGYFGFMQMVLFRLPLIFNKKISFYKLMGSGRGGGFSAVPSWHTWAVLVVKEMTDGRMTDDNNTGNVEKERYNEKTYGKFIATYWRFFKVGITTFILKPIEGFGTWDGKECFGKLQRGGDYTGPIAVLTRASINPKNLRRFYKHANGFNKIIQQSKGLKYSIGIGEAPWLRQATLSVWESKQHMQSFAYNMRQHAEVIKKTRDEKWYTEEMFVRFKILKTF